MKFMNFSSKMNMCIVVLLRKEKPAIYDKTINTWYIDT